MYVFRCTASTRKDCAGLTRSSLSNHAYGLALDFNTAKNPLKTYYGVNGASACQTPMLTDVPQWVVQVAEKWGLYWGGYGWSSGCSSPSQVKSSASRDPMHFEFNGTVAQARHPGVQHRWQQQQPGRRTARCGHRTGAVWWQVLPGRRHQGRHHHPLLRQDGGARCQHPSSGCHRRSRGHHGRTGQHHHHRGGRQRLHHGRGLRRSAQQLPPVVQRQRPPRSRRRVGGRGADRRAGPLLPLPVHRDAHHRRRAGLLLSHRVRHERQLLHAGGSATHHRHARQAGVLTAHRLQGPRPDQPWRRALQHRSGLGRGNGNRRQHHRRGGCRHRLHHGRCLRHAHPRATDPQRRQLREGRHGGQLRSGALGPFSAGVGVLHLLTEQRARDHRRAGFLRAADCELAVVHLADTVADRGHTRVLDRPCQWGTTMQPTQRCRQHRAHACPGGRRGSGGEPHRDGRTECRLRDCQLVRQHGGRAAGTIEPECGRRLAGGQHGHRARGCRRHDLRLRVELDAPGRRCDGHVHSRRRGSVPARHPGAGARLTPASVRSRDEKPTSTR
ncbi:MAG: M15 family metallopeptidase [Acidimicrobiaceae bacterium]|nr:M15 family metallopeptidase [Acidimicrobiaceae bacterium]